MKTVISIFILLCITSATSAQIPFLKVGPKVGVNMVKVSGQSFNNQFDFGYNIGGFVEIKLHKNWYLQPEVIFNDNNLKRGSGFDTLYKSLNPTAVKNIKLQYLSIPVLLGYKAANILTLQAGLQYGISINKHETLLQNGKEAFKKGDFSILAGGQVNISKFLFSARYAIGLTSLNDLDKQDNWKSQTIQLGVGIVL